MGFIASQAKTDKTKKCPSSYLNLDDDFANITNAHRFFEMTEFLSTSKHVSCEVDLITLYKRLKNSAKIKKNTPSLYKRFEIKKYR